MQGGKRNEDDENIMMVPIVMMKKVKMKMKRNKYSCCARQFNALVCTLMAVYRTVYLMPTAIFVHPITLNICVHLKSQFDPPI